MNLRRQSVHLMTMEKEQVLVLENITKAYGTRFSKEKSGFSALFRSAFERAKLSESREKTVRAKARFFPLRRALKDRMREKSNLRRSDADSWDTFRRKSHFIPH